MNLKRDSSGVRIKAGWVRGSLIKHLTAIAEVQSQTDFAMMAFQDLKAALAVKDTRRTWYSVQGFLIAAANLSKLLYSKQSRCTELRTELGLKDASPIAAREVRNSFEHFDERIEAWEARSKWSDSLVMPLKDLVPGWKVVRHLDPTTFTVIFGDDRFALLPALEEVRLIRAAADAALRPILPERRKQR